MPTALASRRRLLQRAPVPSCAPARPCWPPAPHRLPPHRLKPSPPTRCSLRSNPHRQCGLNLLQGRTALYWNTMLAVAKHSSEALMPAASNPFCILTRFPASGVISSATNNGSSRLIPYDYKMKRHSPIVTEFGVIHIEKGKRGRTMLQQMNFPPLTRSVAKGRLDNKRLIVFSSSICSVVT